MGLFNSTKNTDLQSTNDYSLFKLHPNNRDVDKKHVDSLKASMQVKYIMQPIIVNNKMEVIDGQHRLKASEELGYEVYFIKGDYELSDMVALNTNQKNWSLPDYVNYHATSGNKTYQQLLDLSNEFGVTISLVYYNTIANKDVSGNTNKKETKTLSMFKNGTLQFNYEDTYALLEKASNVCIALETKMETRLVAAIRNINQSDNYDHDRMVAKCKKYNYLFELKRNASEYIDLLEQIYNFHNKYKLSLKY